MDYRASSTAALSKKLGSSTGGTSIYDGVFSGSAPFRASTFSSRVEDFGEIFNGGGDSRRISSIPVLDVPALRERKVSVDARSSRLEYANIFGGSGVSDGVASYEDLPAESRKMRTFTREERTRVGTRSPSEVSFSGSEDSQVLPHSSDKAKKFNLSYNRSNLGSKDGTNGTTHVTQLHDVPGFARVIDGTDIASARDGDEKAKSPVFGSTPEKSHKNVDQNVSPSNGYGTPSPSRFFTNNFNSKDVEASPSKVSVSDGGEGNFGFSPSYFDEELDANSAAAASAAAVRKAIDQAQEKIKIAKEIMERRKDMFQGNSYFNGSGAGKRKEAKKAKKVIKFSEMEENAEPNRFAASNLMNIEDISGQALEFRRAETQAQPCIRERDSMDGDEANEMRTLVKKIEIEKKTDDYVMQKTVTAELSSEVSMESEARGNLENSNLPAYIMGHEYDVYGDDHESAEQLHYLKEKKEEFEVEYEEQSEENVEVDNSQRQCEDELQELRDSEVEKKLEDQSMDCVWEEIVKKPKESKKEEEEEEGNVEREKECFDRLDSGKNFEDDGKEFDGFHLGDESKELNADAEELLEKSDCLLDGEEEQEHREEDNYSEMQQDAFDQQMEEEEIQTKIDLQTEAENQEIHSNGDKSDNELESSVESSENLVANNSDDLEEKDVFDQQFEEEEIQTKIDLQTEAENQEIHVPSDVDKSDNELESSVESSESLVANNSDDLEEKEVTDSSSLDKEHKVVNESTSEEARGLGTFRLSWGSLSVSEITGLNENTVKLGFPDINIGQWHNVEEPKNVQNAEETETVPVGDNEDVREEETSSSSSGKGEAEAFINQEDEFSEYDDSLVDSEVNIEADWQSDMFEKKEETVEGKSDQSSDQGDEKSDSFLEPQRNSIKKTAEDKTEEDKTEECLDKTEEEREKEKERERKRELEKERIAVDRAIREARERAFAEARERAERAAVEKATAEARQRMAAHAREKMAKTEAAAVNERRSSEEARLRAQRAAVERATAEARERALEKALSEKLSGIRKDGKVRQRSMNEPQQKSSSSTSNTRNSTSSSNGAPQSGERYGGANDESAQRSKARLERHQRTAERAAKALAEKNMRDLLAQREQVEKNRLAEALDADIKRWSSGKHGNLRALLSTLQYILGAESGWQAVSLTEIVTSAAVKKAYRKATLCVHPDKLQQRGASLQQKYICEKVFDLLKEAWNRFSAEEK